jgi:hypothetical protein
MIAIANHQINQILKFLFEFESNSFRPNGLPPPTDPHHRHAQPTPCQPHPSTSAMLLPQSLAHRPLTCSTHCRMPPPISAGASRQHYLPRACWSACSPVVRHDSWCPLLQSCAPAYRMSPLGYADLLPQRCTPLPWEDKAQGTKGPPRRPLCVADHSAFASAVVSFSPIGCPR